MGLGARQRFGRYVALESSLHLLNPPFKILMFAMIIASIFLSTSWLHLACVAGYVLVLCVVSRVRIWFYIETLKYFSWMFALSFAVNALFPAGGTSRALSFGALDTAGIFTVRLVLMVIAATLLTVVTCPSEIGDSVLVLAHLRGSVGRKAAEFASLLSIALRFVPVMFEEADRIRAAQMLRGQAASSLIGRIRAVVGLIVPLMDSSLRRAANLGFALEARCYGYRVPKTRGLRLGKREIIIGFSGLAILLALVVMR